MFLITDKFAEVIYNNNHRNSANTTVTLTVLGIMINAKAWPNLYHEVDGSIHEHKMKD